MIFAANDRAYNDVFAGFLRRNHSELLCAWHELEIPPGNRLAILGAQKGKAMDKTFAIAVLSLFGSHPKSEHFIRFHSDNRFFRSRDFVAAVVIRQNFNDTP